jgi:hypothetical protein
MWKEIQVLYRHFLKKNLFSINSTIVISQSTFKSQFNAKVILFCSVFWSENVKKWKQHDANHRNLDVVFYWSQCSWMVNAHLSTRIGFLCQDACIAFEVNITSRQTITSINGQTNFDGSYHTIVDIKRGVVDLIPEGLEKFFPNLEALTTFFSKLKHRTSYSLSLVEESREESRKWLQI